MTQSAFDIELDEFTLARARRGDVAACETLFRLYNRPAYSIAFRVCQCPQLAQDVTQEAFISAFRRIGQFRGDSPFWGWMRRVVVNHAISALRRQPKSAPVELEEHHASAPGQQERIGLSMDLEKALSKLSSEDRTVVWLHDVEGYNHKEIASFFDRTESFSKTRLSRARARLRELIDPLMNPSGDKSNDEEARASKDAHGQTESSEQPVSMLSLSSSF